MVTSGVEGHAGMESSERRWFLVAYRVAFALLGIAAMVYQLDRTSKVVNFFSFFTIQSNIIAAAVLLYTAYRAPDRAPSRTVDLLRGAATFYIATTGIVYNLLLTEATEVQGSVVDWVNSVVHVIIPIAVVLEWLIDPPRTRLTWRGALVWVIYPLIWTAYTLIRGPIVDWYPYPFINPDDPDTDGWGGVFINCLIIAVGLFALIWVIVAVGNKMRAVVRANEG